MQIDPENYAGREQAYVKHYFLAQYLEGLIFKTSSVFDEIIYIDGFSGPWQNKGERFEDTSFGIALNALTKAKQTWAAMNNFAQRRQVKMTAHLIERDRAAFARLEGMRDLFPEVQIIPHFGDFTEIAPKLASALPRRAFSFVLIDPKGWTVDLRAIEPLISRDNSEVVFNFMFDFINRFALSDDPSISDQLDRLIPGRDWRSPIRAIDDVKGAEDNRSAPEARKTLLVEEFKAALSAVGNYKFVADVDVMRPTRDRTLYFLVYGTRRPPGIEVFRNCHVASLKQQSDIRGKRKLEGKQSRTGQFELLASTNEMGPDMSSVSLIDEERLAVDDLLNLAPTTPPGVRWDTVWPAVLSRRVIRLTDLKRVANDLRKGGQLVFPDWPSNSKRTPDDEYRLYRDPTVLK